MFEATMLLIFITAIDVAHIIKTHKTILVRHNPLNTIYKYQKKFNYLHLLKLQCG